MKKLFASLAAGLLLAAATSADANTYTFTYVFVHYSWSDDTIVTGSVDGDANGDLITNLSNVKLAINGVDFGENVQISGWASPGATMSFSGKKNEFTLTSADNLMFFGMTYLFNVGPRDPAVIFRRAVDQDQQRFDAADMYTSGSWQIADTAVTPVPEPASYALFLSGIAIVAAAARRRKQA
jgi:hypothetical protein